MPMRSSSIPLLLLLGCALSAAGCTVHGQGKASKPGWKTLVTKHPLLGAPVALRSGYAEVQIQAVVLEDRHTVVGSSSWVAVLRGVVTNRGQAPLQPEVIQQSFRFQHRSGVERRGTFFVQGTGGWNRQERTSLRTELPPGATGAFLVQTDSGPDGVRDDPVAVVFEGQRVELR